MFLISVIINDGIGFECVTKPEYRKVKTQGNDIMYQRNPYKCALKNVIEKYDVKVNHLT